MSTGQKRPHAEALADAEAFRDLFPAACYERWEIAGSVRRWKPEVGDIEHVVVPRMGEVETIGGLFAQRETVNLLWHHADAMLHGRQIEKHVYGYDGFRWGPRYRGVDFRGYLHELYTARPETWGAILLIRTGPHDYSQRVVDTFKRGGVYRQQDGALRHVASGEIVPAPDERTYLNLAGLPWVEPERRS